MHESPLPKMAKHVSLKGKENETFYKSVQRFFTAKMYTYLSAEVVEYLLLNLQLLENVMQTTNTCKARSQDEGDRVFVILRIHANQKLRKTE